MLESLELNYFKKHERLSLCFTEGLNGVTGPNYRGKTTVLYGILYCLGGARLVPGKRLHTRGTNSGFRQELTLSFAGKGRYRIERTKSGASLTELCTDGTEQLVATGTSPVNQAVARLLGMPLKRFAQIKYARQRKAAALLEAGSTELFKIITELTGLERVGLVIERVSSQLKAWRTLQEETSLTDISEQQVQVLTWVSEETGLQTQLAELEADIDQLKAQRTLTADTERRLSVAQTAVYGASTSLRQAEREVLDTQAAVADAERKLQEFRGEPLWTEQLGPLEQQLSELREAALEGKQVRSMVKQIQSDLQGEQGCLQASLKEVEHLRADLHFCRASGPEAGIEAHTATMRDAAATAKASVQTDSDKLREMIEAGKNGVCEGCQRPFDAFDPAAHAEHVAVLQAALREKMAEAEVVKSQLDASEKLLKRVTGLEAELTRADSLAHAHQQACDRLSSQLEAATRTLLSLPPADQLAPQIEQLEERIEAGRQDATRYASLNQLVAVAQGNLAPRMQAAEAAKYALQQVEVDHQVVGVDLAVALQLHRDNGDQLDSQIRRLNEQAGELRNQKHAVHEQRIALERSLVVAVERNRQHQDASSKVGLLTELLGHIRSNRDRYSKQVWDVFMASASMFASSATGGVIESISRGEDGAFTFVEDGYEMEQAEASGAQLAIIGTAVQLALDAAALSPLNLVLLDEPTADMDPERALAFSTLLASSGKQVVMVTHRDMDATVFDNTLEI